MRLAAPVCDTLHVLLAGFVSGYSNVFDACRSQGRCMRGAWARVGSWAPGTRRRTCTCRDGWRANSWRTGTSPPHWQFSPHPHWQFSPHPHWQFSPHPHWQFSLTTHTGNSNSPPPTLAVLTHHSPHWLFSLTTHTGSSNSPPTTQTGNSNSPPTHTGNSNSPPTHTGNSNSPPTLAILTHHPHWQF